MLFLCLIFGLGTAAVERSFMNKAMGTQNPLTDAWQARRLIARMVKREVVGRYKGSVLGLLWSFVNPLVMLAIYSVVFGFIFQARWGIDTQQNFAIILFTGLIFHALLAEVINRAPTLMLENANYVKKVVFPLQALGWIALGSAFFHFCVSLLILLLGEVIVSQVVPWTWVYLPFVVLPWLIFCLGVTWFLASLGVYIRDIAQVSSIAVTLFLFLAPILYPKSIVPESYQMLLYLNPLTYIVAQARAVLVWGQPPDFAGLALYTLGMACFTQLAYLWFQKTKKGFADVL